MKRALIALTAAAAIGAAAAPAQAVPVTTAAVAQDTVGTTLAQRNAYIGYVAPATEVGPSLRVKLLSYGLKACEGIRAGVPTVTLVAGLKRQYGLTSSEAWRVYYGADKHLC